MNQTRKRQLAAEIIIILLPMLAGFISSWPARLYTAFLLPAASLILFTLSWRLTAENAPQVLKQSSASTVIFIIIPAAEYFSLFMILYPYLHLDADPSRFTEIFMGTLFVIIGNLLGRIEQNSVIGIRTSWSLQNRDNWNYSNRMTGIAWTLCGFIMLLSVLLENGLWLFIAALTAVIITPIYYSYSNYRKQQREGTWKVDDENASSSNRLAVKYGSIIGASVLVLAAVLAAAVFLSAGYTAEVGKDGVKIDARLVSDSDIDYDSMQSIELSKKPVDGSRIFGYGGINMQYGTYQNADLGRYRRYTNFDGPAIIIRTDEEIYVINDKDDRETEKLYQEILDKKESSGMKNEN